MYFLCQLSFWHGLNPFAHSESYLILTVHDNFLDRKNATFWVLTSCSSERPIRLGETYDLCLQARRVSQAWRQMNQKVSWRSPVLYHRVVLRQPDVAEKQKASRSGACRCFFLFLAWLTLQPWRCMRYVTPKRYVTSEICYYSYLIPPSYPQIKHAWLWCPPTR
jgi:hypothetical protein